jgi:hypothetical protein
LAILNKRLVYFPATLLPSSRAFRITHFEIRSATLIEDY